MCSFLMWKYACFNNREFDIEGDLVGVPHTCYLSGQSFITPLKLVWRKLDMVAMNNWKKCVGLKRTWVSKHIVLSFSSCALNLKEAVTWITGLFCCLRIYVNMLRPASILLAMHVSCQRWPKSINVSVAFSHPPCPLHCHRAKSDYQILFAL